MDSLKQSMEEMTAHFNKKMSEFQRELTCNPVPPASSSPTSRLAAEFEAFREFVISSLKSLQSQVELLSKLYEQQEMRSRRKILLLHGVAENNNEDVSAAIINIVSNKLDIANVTKDSISRCHRFGRIRDDKPRPIVVKFQDIRIRDSVWAAKSRLKKTGITLSEFLTKGRHDTFMAARERFGVSQCWTRDGYIFLISSNGSKHRISCLADLDRIPCAPSASSSGAIGGGEVPQKDVKANAAVRSKRLPRGK